MRRIVCTCVVFLLAGCMTLEQMAPPVGPDLLAVGERQGVGAETLRLGRDLYVTDCARCHSVEPIERYTVRRWRDALPRMAREAKLNRQQTEAVTAYVLAVRAGHCVNSDEQLERSD